MIQQAPRIKICGIRDPRHAVVAAEAGADFLGINFVEGVRRQVQPDEGARIVADYRSHHGDGGPKIAGLFRNQPAEWVNRVAREAALDLVQLCGDEDDAYSAGIEKPIIRPVRVRDGMSRDELEALVTSALLSSRMVLLDRYDPEVPGGGGTPFNWAIAESVANRDNVLLAGGLTPENVGSAISRLRPWGVDVSTGVEAQGNKDPARIRAFIKAARSR